MISRQQPTDPVFVYLFFNYEKSLMGKNVAVMESVIDHYSQKKY